MARIASIFLLVVAVCFSTTRVYAGPLRTKSEVAWIEEIEQQAIEKGISPDIVHEALDDFKPNRRVIELYQRQPETTISFAAYRRISVAPARVKKGAELMRLYAGELNAIEARTGVPPEVVMALWAVESSFGQKIGDFEVVDALATLAFEGRRAVFFRNQLFAAFQILEREHMEPADLRGSWAGALGQCQFMPSVYLKYAVDENSDGKRDIWNDPVDALGSIATYLAAEGWKRAETWGREAEGGEEAPAFNGNLGNTISLQEWEPNNALNGFAVTERAPASVVEPDGEDGPRFLVYDNFRALMRWNRSTYFALSVGLLADKIKAY